MTELINFSLDTFIVLLVVMDPVGMAPVFLGLTHGGSAHYRRRMAIRGVAISSVVLLVFLWLGEALLGALGVGFPAMRIGGGILLFLLAIDMVFARQTGLRSTTPSEQEEAEHRNDISVFPLAIPLIAGPGTITSLILIKSQHSGDLQYAFVTMAVLAGVLLLTLISLLLANPIMKLIGETGANVISRVLGILLAALAVQFILDGLRAAFAGA